MIAHRFRNRTASVPTRLAESGHRHARRHAQDGPPPAPSSRPSSGPSGESQQQQPPRSSEAAAPPASAPPFSLPQPGPAPPPETAASPPPRPPRNAERIAADRQKITEAGLIDLLLGHVRGERDLTASQLSTAFGLLRKILPDFANSAAPREGEGGGAPDPADGASGSAFAFPAHGQVPCPEFEVHIVDAQQTEA